MLLLSLSLFLLALALPAIPSIFEVMRPHDDGKLQIAEGYVRDARWFGRAFRAKLAPFVHEARAGGSVDSVLAFRTDEEVHWQPNLRIPPAERLRGIGIGERVVVGHDSGIRDAYALETLDVERGVTARTLTSDDTLRIADSVRILRWIDADGDISVGADSDLGHSASGGSQVRLGERVHFERVWGAPVRSQTACRKSFQLTAAKSVVDASTLQGEKPLILYGTVRVAGGTRLPSHLKVHGTLGLEPGVVVVGNVIARGDVTLASNVTVGGHIFCEGEVRLGPGSRVGRASVAKTVYATGAVLIADDVEVYGWILSENGGRTL